MQIHGQCVDILVHGYEEVYSDYMNHDGIYVKLDLGFYWTIQAAKASPFVS